MVTIDGITTEEQSETNFLAGGTAFPTVSCVGETIEAEIDGKSFADEVIRGRLVVLDLTREEAITFDGLRVEPGQEVEEIWETTIPAEGLGEGIEEMPGSVEVDGTLQYLIVSQELVDGEWLTTHSTFPPQYFMGIAELDLTIDGVNAPDSLCQGENLQVSVNVRNTSDCDVEIRARFNSDTLPDSVTDTVDLQGGGSASFTYQQDNVPGRGANIDVVIESVSETGTTELLSDTITVDLLPVGFDLIGVEIPDSACFGTDFDVSGTLRNVGDCSAEVRVRASLSGRDDQTTQATPVQPGNSMDFSFTIQDMPENSVNVNIIAEIMEGGAWSEIDRVSQNVSALFADLRIVNTVYPDAVRPGEDVEADITIANDGDCSASFTLDGTLLDTVTDTIEPGDSIDITHMFSINVIEQLIDLELINNNRNTTEDTFSTTVRAHQAVFIDTDDGVSIIGGFNNSVGYNIGVQGTDLEEEDFEETDRVRIGRRKRAGVARGSASPDPTDLDTIRFTNVDYVNGLVDREIVVVVDNEIIETTQSFKYTVYPFGIVEARLPAPAPAPDVVIQARPRDMIGRVRNRVS